MLDGLVVAESSRQHLIQAAVEPSHAMLLTGHTGIGKSLLAQRLAANWLGLAPDRLASSQYVRLVVPEKDTISIEKIRSLRQFILLKETSNRAVKRVIMLFDADRMTLAAQNALLKILEEPPAGTVLLLTTSRLKNILPTIVSRAQIVPLQSPTQAELQQHVATKHLSGDTERAYMLADGSIARFLQLMSGDDASASPLTLAKDILKATRFERLLYVDRDLKDKSVAREVAATLASLASAALTSGKAGDRTEQWHRVLRAANTADEALSKNANTKLTLTELMLSL